MSPFDTSGPSLSGKDLKRGYRATKKSGPPITYSRKDLPQHVLRVADRNRTTKLDHPKRPDRQGPI